MLPRALEVRHCGVLVKVVTLFRESCGFCEWGSAKSQAKPLVVAPSTPRDEEMAAERGLPREVWIAEMMSNWRS